MSKGFPNRGAAKRPESDPAVRRDRSSLLGGGAFVRAAPVLARLRGRRAAARRRRGCGRLGCRLAGLLAQAARASATGSTTAWSTFLTFFFAADLTVRADFRTLLVTVMVVPSRQNEACRLRDTPVLEPSLWEGASSVPGQCGRRRRRVYLISARGDAAPPHDIGRGEPGHEPHWSVSAGNCRLAAARPPCAGGRSRRASRATSRRSSAAWAATAAPATARSRARTASGCRCSAPTRPLDHDRLLREFGGRRLEPARPRRQPAAAQGDRPGGPPGRQAHGRRQPRVRDPAPLDRRRGAGRAARAVARDPAARHARPSRRSSRARRYRLRVEATFADGTAEDVTPPLLLRIARPAVAAVDRDGQVTARGVGDAALDRPLPRRAGAGRSAGAAAVGRRLPRRSSRTTSSTGTSWPSCAG